MTADAARPADAPARLTDGAALLLAELQAEGARLTDLRARVEACAIRRGRIEAALRALLPTLPPDAARALRRRLDEGARQPPERPRGAPADTLMRLLAGWTRPAITVAEAQAHVVERGHTVQRTYAAGMLKLLAARGVVAKVGRGRYRVVKGAAELVEIRLDWED
jgi:hypothetical protein